jgi:hypothetical protein
MTADHPELPKVFEAQVGLSPREYFSALAYFLAFGSGKPLENLKNPDACGLLDLRALTPTAGTVGRITSAYLSAEAQVPNELDQALWGGAEDAEEARATSLNLNALRSKPILRVRGERGVIIDQVFMAERATAGPLFHLVAADRRRANDWFARFGDAFEAYVMEGMQQAFGPSSGPLQRFFPKAIADAPQNQQVELTDAVLLDANDAVFFEIKAVWMSERTPQTAESPEKFLAGIRKRYSTTERTATKEQRLSGVGQLGRALRRLASSEWVARDLCIRRIQRIYPVLLVHDAYLDAAVHSQFLAQELTEDLSDGHKQPEWAPMKCGSLTVQHLVVLTIDEWELVENSLERISFADCLRDYDRQCPDRLTSFRDFLLTSRYRDLLSYSSRLRHVRDSLLDEAVENLFPEGGTTSESR